MPLKKFGDKINSFLMILHLEEIPKSLNPMNLFGQGLTECNPLSSQVLPSFLMFFLAIPDWKGTSIKKRKVASQSGETIYAF
jgi:hypothetical protein